MNAPSRASWERGKQHRLFPFAPDPATNVGLRELSEVQREMLLHLTLREAQAQEEEISLQSPVRMSRSYASTAMGVGVGDAMPPPISESSSLETGLEYLKVLR